MNAVTPAALLTTLVAIAVVAAVAVLTWHGSITGEAAVGLFGAVLGGGAVGGAQHASFKAGARAAKGIE